MTDDHRTAPPNAPSPWLAAGAAVAVIAVHAGVLLAAWGGAGTRDPERPDTAAVLTVATLEPPAVPPQQTAPAAATTPQAHPAHPAASPPPATMPPAVLADASAQAASTPDSDTPPQPTDSAPDSAPDSPAAPPDANGAPSAEPTPPQASAEPGAANRALASAALPKAMPPESAHWNYDATIKVGILSLSGNAWLNWQQDGRHYQADLQYQVLGRTMLQTSTGTLSDQGLQPDTFVEKGRRTVFDHEARQMRRDGADAGVALPPDTHDKLSVIVQLGSLLAALPDGPHPGDRWSLPVAGASSIAPWTFRYVAEPAGSPAPGGGPTWQVAYEPQNPEDDQIRIWYARQPSGLPMRLLIRQSSGNAVDLRYSGR